MRDQCIPRSCHSSVTSVVNTLDKYRTRLTMRELIQVKDLLSVHTVTCTSSVEVEDEDMKESSTTLTFALARIQNGGSYSMEKITFTTVNFG